MLGLLVSNRTIFENKEATNKKPATGIKERLMKCFTLMLSATAKKGLDHLKVTEGIRVVKKAGASCIILSKGGLYKDVLVPLSELHPPNIRKGKIYDAELAKIDDAFYIAEMRDSQNHQRNNKFLISLMVEEDWDYSQKIYIHENNESVPTDFILPDLDSRKGHTTITTKYEKEGDIVLSSGGAEINRCRGVWHNVHEKWTIFQYNRRILYTDPGFFPLFLATTKEEIKPTPAECYTLNNEGVLTPGIELSQDKGNIPYLNPEGSENPESSVLFQSSVPYLHLGGNPPSKIKKVGYAKIPKNKVKKMECTPVRDVLSVLLPPPPDSQNSNNSIAIILIEGLYTGKDSCTKEERKLQGRVKALMIHESEGINHEHSLTDIIVRLPRGKHLEVLQTHNRVCSILTNNVKTDKGKLTGVRRLSKETWKELNCDAIEYL